MLVVQSGSGLLMRSLIVRTHTVVRMCTAYFFNVTSYLLLLTSCFLVREVDLADLSKAMDEDNTKVKREVFLKGVDEVEPALGAGMNTLKMYWFFLEGTLFLHVIIRYPSCMFIMPWLSNSCFSAYFLYHSFCLVLV